MTSHTPSPGRPDRGAFQTEAGHRTPMSGGERTMIGLAGVALVAGVLIAISKVVPFPDLISAASATPAPSGGASAEASVAPSRTPRPTSRPQPLREVALVEGTPDPAAQEAGWGWGSPVWIRARVDLAVRLTPESDGFEMGTIAAGEAALVSTSPEAPDGPEGWMRSEAPYNGGWIATARSGEPLVDRYSPPAAPPSDAITGLAAGPGGFVAIARHEDPARSAGTAVALTSRDGVAWTRHPTDMPWDNWGAIPTPAWGPAGWLTVVTTYLDRGSVWVYQSPDGGEWTALGRLPVSSNAWAAEIVSSEVGYLMTVGDRGDQPGLWFSDDGVHWFESEDPGFARSAWVNVRTLSAGFYAWDGRQPVPDGDLPAAFSADGQTWTPVPNGPGGPTVLLTSVGARVIGLELSAELEIRAWSATNGATLAWERDSVTEAAFSRAMVSSLTSDGARAYAFGWDMETDQPLAWIGTDAGFVRTALPAEFVGLPRFAAASRSGVAVVEARPNLRLAELVFWHRTPAGRWAPEAQPVIPPVPGPDPAACPPPPSDLLEFIAFDPALGVVCHPEVPITLRGWASSCDWCGESDQPEAEPAWLAEPGTNRLALSPINSDPNSYGSYSLNLVIGPDLARSPEWIETWVEVTGHFDDPAAATCRASPATVASPRYAGRMGVILGCRLVFVVTAVRVVEGP